MKWVMTMLSWLFLENIADKIGTETLLQALFKEFCHLYCVIVLFVSQFL